MSRAPTLLDRITRDLGTCKVAMKPNPWVLSWSGGQIGCITIKRGGDQ